MIYLYGISVTFSKNMPLERKALKSLNLKIHPGEFITIIGNNGAGKSTLQEILAGNIMPDEGQIYIDNEEITNELSHNRAKLIARVFQDPKTGTCDNLTIAENMSIAYSRGKIRKLNFALNRFNKTIFKGKLAELEMGLENRLNEPVGNLSGGERQALSLLMATLSPAKLLLLDEHTAALDPKMAEKIMQLTNKLYKQHNLTIIMITHNIEHAFEYGTRTVMLQDGNIIHDLQGKERKSIDPTSLLTAY